MSRRDFTESNEHATSEGLTKGMLQAVLKYRYRGILRRIGLMSDMALYSISLESMIHEPALPLVVSIGCLGKFCPHHRQWILDLIPHQTQMGSQCVVWVLLRVCPAEIEIKNEEELKSSYFIFLSLLFCSSLFTSLLFFHHFSSRLVSSLITSLLVSSLITSLLFSSLLISSLLLLATSHLLGCIT